MDVEIIDKEVKEVKSFSKKSDIDPDLIEVIQRLWLNRKFIFKVVIISGALGLFVAFATPVEYEAHVVILPEISSSKAGGILGQFGSLAALGGINLDQLGQSETIKPELYPDISKSLLSMKSMMYREIYIPSKDTTASVYYYLEELNTSTYGFIKSFTVDLPFEIIKYLKERSSNFSEERDYDFNLLSFSKDEENFIEYNLKKRVNVSIDKKTGLIHLSVKMPDSYVAATLADYGVKYLTNYLTDYRVSKAKFNLEFLVARQEEAEQKFRKVQRELASYKDQNLNVIKASARFEEEMLQAEYNLMFNMYSNLSQQLEQAKILVQEETPVFKILEPACIPNDKVSPKRLYILITFLLLGCFISSFYLLLYPKIKENIIIPLKE